MRVSRLALPVVAAAAAGLASSPAATAPPEATATATATAYERQDAEGTRGLLTASGTREREGAATAVATSVEQGRGRAEAVARAEDVELLDGLVTAESVEVAARATGELTRLQGRVRRLRIEGRLVGSPTTKHVYRLGSAGTLAVLSSGRTGIVGLRATLRAPLGAYPAGTSVSVGYASARASDGAPPAPEPPPPAAEPAPEGEGARKRTREAKRREAKRRGAPRARARRRSERAEAPQRRAAPRLEALRTRRGYAFPVHGGYSYGNDWGAPRQFTGRHEGTDIFAPAGTPVLAVTEGTLHRVGTRAVPGNRMWLRGDRGDAFFYAHLSAFAEGARNGARVRAGDVVGFVGTTGDAERTPPHLHFEIHPGAGGPVNPYPFVRAWEHRRDVPAAAWLARYGQEPGPRPGVLVVVEDFLAG
jgi:murein DD-endopeptidase MepM/ murein hydrolase activator NlpD